MRSRSEVVLDASAVLALLKAEPGAGRVGEIVDRAVIGTVNLAEVASKLSREEVPAPVIRAWLDALELRTEAFDDEQAFAAAELLQATRRRGLSLGDRACLALARRLGATALTADRAWAGLEVGVAIEVIR